MLQYDLTSTRFFSALSSALPSDAEMFSFTVGLLMAREIAYSDLLECDLLVTPVDVEEMAFCLTTHFRAFARDFGDAQSLRERLQEFVGMRIALVGKPNRETTTAPR